MSQNIDTKELYDCANKFIGLANELVCKETSDTIGMALRFAAARYSTFEASLLSKNIQKEKEIIKKKLVKDYNLMLEENLKGYQIS